MCCWQLSLGTRKKFYSWKFTILPRVAYPVRLLRFMIWVFIYLVLVVLSQNLDIHDTFCTCALLYLWYVLEQLWEVLVGSLNYHPYESTHMQCIKLVITCLFAWLNWTGSNCYIFSLKYSDNQLILVSPTNFKGILCLGFLKRAREEKETAKERTVKDLQVGFSTG